ncbi:MAG: TauD/TfdA family dioxygenase [Pseudomonadota bacterium]
MNPISVDPITPAIGAEIGGIDLSVLSADQDIEKIYHALIQFHVIVIRGQKITSEQHLNFARLLGTPQPPHPVYPHVEGFENIMVLHHHADNPPDTDGWHTDVTYQEKPPFASVLVSRKVPPAGGDTLWCSLARAYDTLPDPIKQELEGKRAVHDMGDFRNNFTVDEKDAARLVDAHQRFGSSIHPVVQTHPISGRKYLYVNESFTQLIVGMRQNDSNRLLNYLYNHINQPENQMRLRWEPDTLVMWDNRCTWHYATADYLPAERIMHRITLTDDLREH